MRGVGIPSAGAGKVGKLENYQAIGRLFAFEFLGRCGGKDPSAMLLKPFGSSFW